MKSKHTVKGWAIVNAETGRLMLTGWSGDEQAQIYTTKRAANRYRERGERVVRVTITET